MILRNCRGHSIKKEMLPKYILQAEMNFKGWQRAVADLENYKRRDEQYHAELVNFAESRVLIQFLGLLEDLERVLVHTPRSTEGLKEWRQGAEAVRKRLEVTLAELGIEKLKTIGTEFNPEHHEALMQVEGEKEGFVAEEIASGYKRGKTVLLPAKVKVFKTNAGNDNNNDDKQ